MLPLELYISSEHLPFLLPSNEINYAALSQAPQSAEVFFHVLMNRGSFGVPVT